MGSLLRALHVEQIKKMLKEVAKKWRRKLIKIVSFHTDNASAHRSAIATIATRDSGFEALEHPSYSVDRAPSDLYIFPRLKEYLKGADSERNQLEMNANKPSIHSRGRTRVEKMSERCSHKHGYGVFIGGADRRASNIIT
ncbi:hypothetical protein EVAR_87616_1 [Eumeta japonica]|uniref:Mariner Mos1 transposase n=1 Tax=Eumeta variegata TaxID=151549 RepID=A0A4C1WJL8_EUMVA|nr:hypothetical protein EVAR_87616_1 [Eumeta japonica]